MSKIITVFVVIISLLLVPRTVESNSTPALIPFYIYNAASRFNLDAALLYSVCQVESGCRPKALNRNDGTPEQKEKGIKVKSYGLFQLQEDTVRGLGFVTHRTTYIKKLRRGHEIKVKVVEDFTRDLLKPEINAFYAAKLLRRLYDKHKTTLKVLSAYNAGHPIAGNTEYVNKVVRQYIKYKIDKRF